MRLNELISDFLIIKKNTREIFYSNRQNKFNFLKREACEIGTTRRSCHTAWPSATVCRFQEFWCLPKDFPGISKRMPSGLLHAVPTLLPNILFLLACLLLFIAVSQLTEHFLSSCLPSVVYCFILAYPMLKLWRYSMTAKSSSFIIALLCGWNFAVSR